MSAIFCNPEDAQRYARETGNGAHLQRPLTGEMVATMLRDGLQNMLATLRSGDKEAIDRMWDAEYAAMVEDYERDCE